MLTYKITATHIVGTEASNNKSIFLQSELEQRLYSIRLKLTCRLQIHL
jgi:hypothetical protein